MVFSSFAFLMQWLTKWDNHHTLKKTTHSPVRNSSATFVETKKEMDGRNPTKRANYRHKCTRFSRSLAHSHERRRTPRAMKSRPGRRWNNNGDDRSSRSACKACKDKIQKDELRLGQMVQSQHFDGKIPVPPLSVCVCMLCVCCVWLCVYCVVGAAYMNILVVSFCLLGFACAWGKWMIVTKLEEAECCLFVLLLVPKKCLALVSCQMLFCEK